MIFRPRLKPGRMAQIERAHPLAPNVLCLPMIEGGGNKTFDLSGRGNNGTLTTGAVWAPTAYGQGISMPGAGYVDLGTPAVLNGAGLFPDFTVAVLFKCDAIVGLSLPFGFTNYAGLDVGWGFNQVDSTHMEFYWRGWGAGNTISFSDTSKWHLALAKAQLDPTQGSYQNVYFYLDGVVGTSPQATYGYSAGTSCRFGSGYLTGLFNGQVAAGYAWKRALLDVEIEELTADPFCFLRPARRYWPVGAGAVLQALADSSGSATAEAVANLLARVAADSSGSAATEAVAALLAKATGDSIGSATSEALAALLAIATGDATGSATSEAVAALLAQVAGDSEASASTEAVAILLALAAGDALGSATAEAVATIIADAAGDSIGSATAEAVAYIVGALKEALGDAVGSATTEAVVLLTGMRDTYMVYAGGRLELWANGVLIAHYE